MSVLSDKLQDVFMNIHNKFVDVNSRSDELFDTKADKEDTYTKTEVDEKLDVKADKSEIPIKVSDLENDKNYVTPEETEVFVHSDTLASDYYSANYIDNIVNEVSDKLSTKADSADVYDSVYIDGQMASIGMTLGDIMTELQDTNYRIADLYTNKADKTTIIYITEPIFSFEFSALDNVEIRGEVLTSLSFTFGDDEYGDDYTSGISFDSGETPTAIDYTDSGILNWVGVDCTTSNGLSIFQPSPNTHYDIVFYFNGRQFIGLVNGFVPATGNVVSE